MRMLYTSVIKVQNKAKERLGHDASGWTEGEEEEGVDLLCLDGLLRLSLCALSESVLKSTWESL